MVNVLAYGTLILCEEVNDPANPGKLIKKPKNTYYYIVMEEYGKCITKHILTKGDVPIAL